MDQSTQFQPRQIAYIVRIKDILGGPYIKEEGGLPNYVKVGSKNVSRVNIIGAVIDNKEENKMQNIIIDDGTEKITVRNFEKKINVNVGEVVLIIGKIRQYGAEKYITPEILKRGINIKWNVLWKKYALKPDEMMPIEVLKGNNKNNRITEDKLGLVLSKIKELDDGSGASYEEIKKTVNDDLLISHLLLQGEIFEIRPGKLKVLD